MSSSISTPIILIGFERDKYLKWLIWKKGKITKKDGMGKMKFAGLDIGMFPIWVAAWLLAIILLVLLGQSG